MYLEILSIYHKCTEHVKYALSPLTGLGFPNKEEEEVLILLEAARMKKKIESHLHHSTLYNKGSLHHELKPLRIYNQLQKC